MSLVEAVLRQQMEQNYGPLPRAEDFARARDSSFSEVTRDRRDPYLLAGYRRRWKAKLTAADRLDATQRRYEAKKRAEKTA